jgi:hypothetical protein
MSHLNESLSSSSTFLASRKKQEPEIDFRKMNAIFSMRKITAMNEFLPGDGKCCTFAVTKKNATRCDFEISYD